MALVIVETLSETPLTPDEPTDTDFRILSCMAERNGAWRYSLLSRDRLRMLCTFESPDAESVRESYRKAGGVFNRIWTGSLITPESQPQPHETRLTVVESSAPNGFNDQAWEEAKRQLLPYYTEQGAEWIQSYRSLDRSRLISELNAPNIKAIADAYERFGIPCDRIWSAHLIKP